MDPTPKWPPPPPPPPQLQHRSNAPPPPPPLPQLHYPHPSYHRNPNPSPVPSYACPNPTAAATPYISDPYAPHGGYSAGSTAGLGGMAASGALPGYPKVLPKPSIGPVPLAPPRVVFSQCTTKLYCEVCAIYCDTIEMFNIHNQGKKHIRSLKKRQESPSLTPQIAQAINDVPTKEASVLDQGSEYCEVCKIHCDTKEMLNIHIQGKKHIKTLKKRQESLSSKSEESKATNNNVEAKEASVSDQGPSYRAVCKIYCDTQEVLNIHKQGQKHNKNLQMLQEEIQVEKNETPMLDQSKAVVSKRKKKKEAIGEDLETKKRKILEEGATLEKVKICTVCNVVMNSQTVFDSHIAGSKHAVMLKKLNDATAR